MKLEKFILRNKKRNKRLYQENMRNGYDYVICPVSNERLIKIKRNYIEKILQLPYEEYIGLYPNQQFTASAHKEKIKSGLRVKNEIGLTKYQISQIKSREKLKSVSEDGLTGDQRRGKKLKEIHTSKIDEHGLNGYQRLAKYRTETMLSSGETIESRAHKRRLEKILQKPYRNERKASTSSKVMLQPILYWLDANNIKYYFDNTEYGLYDTKKKRYYFYDLVVPDLFVCIEFQSNAYHPNPLLEDSEWRHWKPIRGKMLSADEKIQYDYHKARVLYEQRNIVTFFVWEYEYEKIKEILCFLKIINTK